MSGLIVNLLRRQALSQTTRRAASRGVKPKKSATVTRLDQFAEKLARRRGQPALPRAPTAAEIAKERAAAIERIAFRRAVRRQRVQREMRRTIPGGRTTAPTGTELTRVLTRERLKVIPGRAGPTRLRARPGRKRPTR